MCESVSSYQRMNKVTQLVQHAKGTDLIPHFRPCGILTTVATTLIQYMNLQISLISQYISGK
jgi:hypothetical protein